MNIPDLKGERIFVSLSSISTYHIEHNKLIQVVCCCLAGELISRGVVYSEACAGGGAGQGFIRRGRDWRIFWGQISSPEVSVFSHYQPSYEPQSWVTSQSGPPSLSSNYRQVSRENQPI